MVLGIGFGHPSAPAVICLGTEHPFLQAKGRHRFRRGLTSGLSSSGAGGREKGHPSGSEPRVPPAHSGAAPRANDPTPGRHHRPSDRTARPPPWFAPERACPRRPRSRALRQIPARKMCGIRRDGTGSGRTAAAGPAGLAISAPCCRQTADDGRPTGTRTQTVWSLSPLSLPIGVWAPPDVSISPRVGLQSRPEDHGQATGGRPRITAEIWAFSGSGPDSDRRFAPPRRDGPARSGRVRAADRSRSSESPTFGANRGHEGSRSVRQGCAMDDRTMKACWWQALR